MGGFLTIGYCFLETFVGGHGFDGGGQSRDRGDPPVPPQGKTLCRIVKFFTEQ